MRVISRLLALLLATAALLLCSCSYKPIEPSEEDLTVVGNIEGHEVYLDELRFAAYTCAEVIRTRYGEDAFEGERKEESLKLLEELVYQSITSNAAIVLLCEEVRIGLGEQAVLDKVDETLAELCEELGGMREYKKYLKENHLTDHLLRYNTEVDLLKNELKFVYVDDLGVIENDDELLIDVIADEVIRVRHVYVPRDEEDAYQKAVAVAERAASGEDMSALMSEYSKDTQTTAEGIFIIDGYASEAYESAAYALSVGECSGVVEDDGGYYVIERMELDVSTIWLNFSYLKQLYQDYTLLSIIDEKQASLSFVPNDAAREFMKAPFDKTN